MRVLRLALVSAPALLAGCWGNAALDEGLTAELQVSASQTVVTSSEPPPGPQFFRGSMPKVESTLQVTDIDSENAIVYPGEENRPLTGRVQEGAQVVAIELQGDVGFWVLPVGQPDPLYPGDLDFTAQGNFSTRLALGNQTIQYQAGDGSGHFGPVNTLPLIARDVDDPQGILIVHCKWDTEADLDLHVEQPDGTEIWAKNQTSYSPPPPGSPPESPDAGMTDIGVLQFDSNGMCVIDGKREENAYWATSAESGVYTVRVDAFSMCGQAEGSWTVSVEKRTDPTVPGPIVATASGTLYPYDTQFPHTGGSGVFALTFTMP